MSNLQKQYSICRYNSLLILTSTFPTIAAMQLTQHTDYGLRLLIVLVRKNGGPVALPGFAAAQGLSYNHVVKVAQALGRAGFIKSHRGRSGGVSLACPADRITIGDVVRALEPGMRLADCARCTLRLDCSTSHVLADALAAFLAVLDQKTLADAARPGEPAFAPWAIGDINRAGRDGQKITDAA